MKTLLLVLLMICTTVSFAALPLKEDTTATIVLGPFLDSTDGDTEEEGLTLSQADVRVSKNGGSFAQKTESTSATHMENGYYSCPIDATDTNTAGRLIVYVHEAGALAVYHEFVVLPALVYDSVIAGTDALQVDSIQVGGNTPIAITDIDSSIAAVLPTNFGDLDIEATTGRVDVGTVIGEIPVALTDIATQIQTELDTAVPGTPTAGSVYAIIKDWLDGGRLDLLLDSAQSQSFADWEDGGRLDLILDSVQADTDSIETKVDAVQVDVDTVDTKADTIIADIAAIDVTADIDIAQLLTATGVTEGETWTFAKAIKVMTAWAAGNWRVKPNYPNVQQLLDPDDGVTVILEMTISTTSPYRTINVLIN